VTWNAERQVTTEKPANAGFFLSEVPAGCVVLPVFRFFDFLSIKSTLYENLWHNTPRNEGKG
jgi:hypothetical protein